MRWITNSAVVRSISGFRPPQSWQLLVKEHSFSLKMRIRFLREMTLLLALLSAVSSMGQDVRPLLLEKEIPLPGVEGRIDHFSVDVPGQRLFIAALENDSVEILDTRRGERVAEIKGLEDRRGFTTILKPAGSTSPREETVSFGSMMANR
jgi:hypothetical protein